jgi:hypothetical protein
MTEAAGTPGGLNPSGGYTPRVAHPINLLKAAHLVRQHAPAPRDAHECGAALIGLCGFRLFNVELGLPPAFRCVSHAHIRQV